jgi:hypothetical protein
MTLTATQGGSWLPSDTSPLWGREKTVGAPLESPRFFAGGFGGARQPFVCLHLETCTKKEHPQGALNTSLRQKCANHSSTLSHSRHTGNMQPTKPERAVLLILGLLLVGAWALIIWMAVIVSHTLIDTLEYIVKLAQMG